MFPEVPPGIRSRVAGADVDQRWKCAGPVLEVEKSRGADLLGLGVWQHLLEWAMFGVIGGVVLLVGV